MTSDLAPTDVPFDALVIGGGFYGCTMAIYLEAQLGLNTVLVVERETDILTRASYTNQARLHNGYHYPRSFTTAYRCRQNLSRFVEDYPDCVDRDFSKIYCIARRNSSVNARQFQRFCRGIGAPCQPAEPQISKLFSSRLVEAVFHVHELAFDAARLRARIRDALEAREIALWTGTEATGVNPAANDLLMVSLQSENLHPERVLARRLFNCTYAGLNRIGGSFGAVSAGIKFEIAEMALVEIPDELQGLAVTVMDGPFFSFLPFPDRMLHTLSHVRYTPHFSWTSKEEAELDPYLILERYQKASRAPYMIRDAARYLPSLTASRLVDSLFEVKALLLANEIDDGRPILIEQHPFLRNAYSILGGKIDNVLDMIDFFNNCLL